MVAGPDVRTPLLSRAMRLNVPSAAAVAALLLAMGCGTDPGAAGGAADPVYVDTDGSGASGGFGVDGGAGTTDVAPDAETDEGGPITLEDVSVSPPGDAATDSTPTTDTTTDAGGDGPITIDAGRPDVGEADVGSGDSGPDPPPDSGTGSTGVCCDGACEVVCELEAEQCCIEFSGGASCVAAGACESGLVAACDGPEDCADGDICCAQGTFNILGGEANVMARCIDDCEYSLELMGGYVSTNACHTVEDCEGENSCCTHSRVPASLCMDRLAARDVEAAGGTCDRP